jgi:hypothetical protein
VIVGAAGIVTGLLVDEDVITIAGAGVGGFGLTCTCRQRAEPDGGRMTEPVVSVYGAHVACR